MFREQPPSEAFLEVLSKMNIMAAAYNAAFSDGESQGTSLLVVLIVRRCLRGVELIASTK